MKIDNLISDIKGAVGLAPANHPAPIGLIPQQQLRPMQLAQPIGGAQQGAPLIQPPRGVQAPAGPQIQPGGYANAGGVPQGTQIQGHPGVSPQLKLSPISYHPAVGLHLKVL